MVRCRVLPGNAGAPQFGEDADRPSAGTFVDRGPAIATRTDPALRGHRTKHLVRTDAEASSVVASAVVDCPDPIARM